jgi:hypothetical protein
MEDFERARKLLQSLPDSNKAEESNPDLVAWRERVATFRAELWPMAPELSPLVAALFGWSCVELDLAGCADCGSRLRAKQPLVNELLIVSHEANCLWRAHRVDPFAALVPGAHSLVAGVHARLASLPRDVLCSVAGLPPGLGDALGTTDERAVLAVCGWSAGPAANTVKCGLCGRIATCDAEVNPITSHRLFCVMRTSRSQMSRIAGSLPPNGVKSSKTTDDKVPTCMWTANLLLGLPDLDLIA